MGVSKLVASIAAMVVAALVLWQLLAQDSDTETERLQDAFNEGTNCGENGIPSRETLDAKALANYTRLNARGARGDGLPFARFVRRTKPELTIIACDVGGPVVRYYDFASPAEADAAVAEHKGSTCLAGSALIDLGAPHLPEYCDALSGEMRRS